MDELDRSFDTSNPNEKIVINVGGQRHETYSNTLRSIPDTRLYWITENPTQLAEYDPNCNEYFFDRHPGVFAQVLNFYRTGKLHCPNDVCGPLFEEELAFWGIDELQVEPCCWLNYKKHREAQAHLDPFESRDSDAESIEDMDMTIYGLVGDSIRRRNRTWWKKYQPRIWTLFDEPYSSVPAQVIAFLILFLIILSVAIFCLETMPYFNEPNTTPKNVIFYIEAVCVAIFTLELAIRFVVCPNKVSFLKMPMNWIDFCAILPFYLQVILNKSNIQTMVVFRVIRLVRVFRIFKLSRHSYGLQILGHTLKSSCSELFLLVFFLSIGVVIFSSIIYYAEKDVAKSHFKTIPHGFWWAVVTMTTLGYGDMVPLTWQGQIVGSLCAVSGVLMIALPVPVIVSNFSLYYSHAKARMNLPKRKRPLIFGAASALRVAQPFAVSDQKPNVITQLMETGGRDDEDGIISRMTSRNSGRLSPLPRSKSPKISQHMGPSGITPRASPRSSTTSPPELNKNTSEVSECRSTNRRKSIVPKPIPQVIFTGSGEITSPETTPLPKSPVSFKLEDVGSVASMTENSDRSSIMKKRASIQTKSLSADSSHGSPRGRRGRRGSIYIVGFTAKHWQNKALSKIKTDRKIMSADNSTDRDEYKPHSWSLSCDACDHRKAKSAEVLLRTDVKESQKHIEAKPAEPRRDSVTIQHNPPSVTNQCLSRVSSATQTSDTRLSSHSSPKSKPRSESCSVPKRAATTGKDLKLLTDDSLCVHRHLNQRRGSSPLRRQHAVFTFDVTDQSSDAKVSSSKANLNQSNSPSLPSMIESSLNQDSDGSYSRQPIKDNETSLNSATYREARPLSMPLSSYINSSFQKEEDETVRRSWQEVNKNSNRKDSPMLLKRAFQPYRKDGISKSPYEDPSMSPTVSITPNKENCDDDQYSRGRRTPIGSLSNSSLPSITEEHNNKNFLRVADGELLKLHRPKSMPLEIMHEEIKKQKVCRSSSLPIGEPTDDTTDQHKTLIQRRQRPELSLSCRPKVQMNQLDVMNYPWIQRILASANLLKVHEQAVNSPSSNRLLADEDDQLLYSPHTPRSMNVSSRRTITSSPSISIWDEADQPLIDLKQTSLDSDARHISPDVKLRPLTRVEDQAGREYALYAIPTGLDGSVFFSRTNSEECESGNLQNNISSEFFALTNRGENISPHSSKTQFQNECTPPLGGNKSENARDEVDESSMRRSEPVDILFKETLANCTQEAPKLPDSPLFNEHDALHPKISGNALLAKRSSILPSPDRRKARMFFGDSGISSVGSGSTASMSHSLDLDIESKERKEATGNILIPIKETDTENSNSRSKVIDSTKPSLVNIMMSSGGQRDTVIDMLANFDQYESSLV